MSSLLHNQVDDLLGKFGAGIGLENCRLDEAGAARIGFDDMLVSFDLDEADGCLAMLTMIGTVGEDRGKALAGLLDANLTREGLVVARDPGTGSVVLLRRLVIEGLELKGFEAALEAFLARAEALRAALAKTEENAPATPPAAATAPDPPAWGNFIRG